MPPTPLITLLLTIVVAKVSYEREMIPVAMAIISAVLTAFPQTHLHTNPRRLF